MRQTLLHMIVLLGLLGIPGRAAWCFLQMQERARTAELPSMLDGLRTAVLAQHAASGDPYASLGARDAPMTAEQGRALGWFPPDARRQYWIEASSDGSRFAVFAMEDIGPRTVIYRRDMP